MFVVKINPEKGTVTVCDVHLTTKAFDVDGYAASTNSGEEPNKFGWFRLLDFHKLEAKIIEHFKLGKDLSKDIECGECTDIENKLYLVKPVKK